MHNIIVSDVMIEILAEKLGVDFNLARHDGYMHADNEKGLFIEAMVDRAGMDSFNGDATHYIVDDETFVAAISELARTWIEQQNVQAEKEEDQ